MGELAKGIQNHQRHRAIAHARHQHQAMAGLVGEAGLGQLDIPVGAVDQVIGVGEAQGVIRLAERHGLFLGGAQLAQHRKLARIGQQLAQVAGGRHVMDRQAGGLHVVGAGHAQGLGLGVHRGNEGRVTAWIVVGEAGGGAVFRRHQRDQQHFLAWHLAADLHPGEHAFHLGRVGDVDVDVLVHILLGFEYDQASHQLAHRGDRYHHVRVAGINDFIGLQVDQHGAAGGDLQLGGVTRGQGGFGGVGEGAC